MLYYFKLFLKNKHIVSWGITKEQNYAGKVMFRLEQARKSRRGGSGVMVRYVLRFAEQKPGHGEAMEVDDFLELRVYRSNGRKQVPYTEAFAKGTTDAIGEESGIRYAVIFLTSRHKSLLCFVLIIILRLAYGGKTSIKHPRAYYKYALEDSLENPFVTIRYYPRLAGKCSYHPSKPKP
jgi:hypothetical protein